MVKQALQVDKSVADNANKYLKRHVLHICNPGTRDLLLCPCYKGLCPISLVQGPGTRSLVPWVWANLLHQGLGIRPFVPRTWYQIPLLIRLVPWPAMTAHPTSTLDAKNTYIYIIFRRRPSSVERVSPHESTVVGSKPAVST